MEQYPIAENMTLNKKGKSLVFYGAKNLVKTINKI